MEKMTAEAVRLAAHVVKGPSTELWIDYDKEADVLYMSFGKPQPADDAELTDDDVIVRTRRGKVVGLTILHASTRRHR